MATLPLANALRDISWLLPRTLARSPGSPTATMPRSEVEVMRLLVRRPGLSVNEAAAELGLKPSNLSASVRSLVARGELVRHRDPGDGRLVRLHPTRKALAVRAAQERAWSAALDQVLDGLAPQQRSLLLDAAPALVALATALAEQAE